MTTSEEEYLEALYALSEDGQEASTSALARRLEVAPASVSEMLRRLATGGYIDYSPYQRATLTPKGFRAAEKMARKHRLLERFLHDVLHIGKDKVHAEACAMEHALSDDTERALCQKLKSPATCPDDGKVIPACNLGFASCDQCRQAAPNGVQELAVREADVVPIASLKEEDAGEIAFIRGETKALRRLLDLGLTPGTKVRILRVAPLKGPVEIAVRGSRLALGEQIACNVFVQDVETAAEVAR